MKVKLLYIMMIAQLAACMYCVNYYDTLYMTALGNFNTYKQSAPSKILYDKYKNDSEKLDNVLRYMRDKMHASSKHIVLSQAYEK